MSTPRAWRGRVETGAAASELKLETSEKMSDPVIHAFHNKLGIQIAVEALEVQGRLSFCYPRFVYMNQVPDCFFHVHGCP